MLKPLCVVALPGGGSCEGDVCPDSRAVSASHECHKCTTDVGDTETVAGPVPVGGPSRGSTGTQVSTSRKTGQSKTTLLTAKYRNNQRAA